MKKILLSIILIITFSNFNASAINPNEIRFHCENDTIKINKLLEEGRLSGLENPNQLVSFYAEKLLGTPYVAHTLEGNPEMLTINIDQLDCTTFIETLIALTISNLENRYTWQDYANNLERIRYRHGELNGYASRLHYISDWVNDNYARGNIREVTTSFPNFTYIIKTLDFMTKHRDSYAAFNDSINYEKVKQTEAAYRSHRYPIIKKRVLFYKDMRKAFKDGDIIALTTKIEGLDVSHLGIIKMVNGAPHLLHASSIAKKVIVDKDDLADMLDHSKKNTGVRVIRIQKPEY